MNTYFVCVAFFVNILPLDAVDTLSNQYRAQLGMFLAKDGNHDGMLSTSEVNTFHGLDIHSFVIRDNKNWEKNKKDKEVVANPALVGNEKLYDSFKIVFENTITTIKRDIEEGNSDNIKLQDAEEWVSSNGNHDLPSHLSPHKLLNVRMEATTAKLTTLSALRNCIEKGLKQRRLVTVIDLVTALFGVIIFHKSGGRNVQLTLDEFISFMSEKVDEKKTLPNLIQNAFKEYMLGLLTPEPEKGITQAELAECLFTHCAFHGNPGENFKHFAKEMDLAGKEVVQVEDVRNKWAKMNVISAINTLVKP